MPIFMTGMMGAGKSTVGKSLAAILNMTFLDLDEEISKSAQMSINEIFSTYGESHFRNLEFQALERACLMNNSVISLGGGALCSQESWAIIPSNAYVIWLKADIQTLVTRLKEDKSRPLLEKDGFKSLNSLLMARIEWYSKAHQHLETDGKSPAELTQEIISHIHGGAG